MPVSKGTTTSKASAQELGYVLGKMEMLEKKFDEHRAESKKELDVVIDKIDKMTHTLSFWRHTLWLVKVIGLSLPFILTANWDKLVSLWVDL